MKNCYYCDFPPRLNEQWKRTYLNNAKTRNSPIDLEFADKKVIFTNGIDRVNNKLGYLLGNVVACCNACNVSKMERTESEFEEWALRLADHIRARRLTKSDNE